MLGKDSDNLKKRVEVTENAVKSGNTIQPKIESQLTETLSKEKVYGKYPGCLDKDFIEKWCNSDDIYSEIQIFLKCENINLAWHQMNHLFPSGRNLISQTSKNDKYAEELKYAKYFLIAQTEKFGVKMEKAKNRSWIMMGSSFMKWYNYRESFFDSLDNLSDEDAQLFALAYNQHEDLSKYLPPKPEKW